MTSIILRCCVSGKQKEAMIKVLKLTSRNYGELKSINDLIDFIQKSIGTYYIHCKKRNCCNKSRYLFTVTFGNSSYILLSKFYDFKYKIHHKEIMYIIDSDGTVEIG